MWLLRLFRSSGIIVLVLYLFLLFVNFCFVINARMFPDQYYYVPTAYTGSEVHLNVDPGGKLVYYYHARDLLEKSNVILGFACVFFLVILLASFICGVILAYFNKNNLDLKENRMQFARGSLKLFFIVIGTLLIILFSNHLLNSLKCIYVLGCQY